MRTGLPLGILALENHGVSSEEVGRVPEPTRVQKLHGLSTPGVKVNVGIGTRPGCGGRPEPEPGVTSASSWGRCVS